MHSLIRNDPIKISIKTICNADTLAVETKKRENSQIDRQHNIESSLTDRQRLIDIQMDKDNNISQKVSNEMDITFI